MTTGAGSGAVDLELERLIGNIQDPHLCLTATDDQIKEAILYLLLKEKDRQNAQQEIDKSIASLYSSSRGV